MNQHLTWEQISEYLIDDASPRQARHARECLTCRSELARLEMVLSDFRSAVRQWIDPIFRRDFQTSIVMEPGAAAHLDRLLMPDSLVEQPWYQRIGGGIGSLAVHAAMIGLVLFLGSLKPVREAMKEVVTLVAPSLPVRVENKNGGGGGARQPAMKKAEWQKARSRQFTPLPKATFQTKLDVPSLSIDAPDISPTAIGTLIGLTTNGSEYDGGFGNGSRSGIGGDKGSGAGTGASGGSGEPDIYRPGAGITNPVAIYKPEPQYSEEARKAKWQGSVLLSLVVDESGKPINITVVRSLGLGLDEKAVEAVSQWRFTPGKKDGKPVAVAAQIEVTFRLL